MNKQYANAILNTIELNQVIEVIDKRNP